MKIKTRIYVTFLLIIILPLLLFISAFFLVGNRMASGNDVKSINNQDYSIMGATVESLGEEMEKILDQVERDNLDSPGILEQEDYLDELAGKMKGVNSFILVRKADRIFYTDNEEAAESLIERLPQHGNIMMDAEAGIYYSDLQKLVKQYDFHFTDGEEGSLFIVAQVKTIISRQMMIDMLLSIIGILLFTSIMLTKWIEKGIYKPIVDIGTALQNVAEGNLEYRMETYGKGEITSLYSNYEEMRLRLKESADEKIEHERANRELISNISHDLKTPITAIKGYVEGIMDGVADTPEKVDKYIKTIYNKANDMDKLINELTVYSGIDNNRIPYSFHRINVAEYFGDCVEEVGLDLDSKNIKLHYYNVTDPDTTIIADPEQIKRVINNIISNSIKYMDKPDGVIEIRILDVVDSIRIEIEDNGRGISAKDLPNIFERFYRTDASRNSAMGGSGIGLSIVKKIVEDHGGYIWATGKEGEGTCMHIVLRKYVDKQDE